MVITKKELESNRERYKNDKGYHDLILDMFRKYMRVPDKELVISVPDIGTVKMGGKNGRVKRTYLFTLDDKREGNVWHNKGKFIVRINNKPVDKETFDLVKDLVVMGYYGTQAKLFSVDSN